MRRESIDFSIIIIHLTKRRFIRMKSWTRKKKFKKEQTPNMNKAHEHTIYNINGQMHVYIFNIQRAANT